MKFGSTVLVTRGSEGVYLGHPGCLRRVKGTLIGRRGKMSLVRLLQDDPLATVGYCTKEGEVGQWDTSCVRRFVIPW